MDIRSVVGIDLSRIEIQVPENHCITDQLVFDADEKAISINLQEEMNNAVEEAADLLSVFGRFSKVGRKNDNADNDLVSSILEDMADEKINYLITHVTKLRNLNNLLNYARQLFPNDSDLMLALREMLLSRRLSELQKKKIREAIADLEKFSGKKKMQSGMNVGHLAKRFSNSGDNRPLSAKDLRNSYLNFLELEMPAAFIYKDWIDAYGYQNRTRLLVFTLSALIADMKANEPGIHFSEFGPLTAKLSDARLLHSLDLLLNKNFSKFPFGEQIRNNQQVLGEMDIVCLYIAGLVDTDEFKLMLKEFSKKFMSLLLLKHQSMIIQELRNIYNMTPEFLFADSLYRDVIINHLATLLRKMFEKEKNTGVWSEHYK